MAKITIGIVIAVLLMFHLIIKYAPGTDFNDAMVSTTYILAVVTFVTVLIHSFSSARSDDILDELEELKNENKALRERLDEKTSRMNKLI